MASAPAHDPAASNTPAPAPTRRRYRFPLAVVLIEGALLGILWAMPADSFDRGLRMSATFLLALVAMLVVTAWFFLFSGAARRQKLLGAAGLVVAIGAVLGAVRRVEFSGDMEPTVDWRFSTAREVVLERHRAARRATETPPLRLASIAPEDVPQYRGAARNGVVVGPPLSRDWQVHPPKQLWKQPAGGGYASFAVVGEVAFTIEQRRENEAIVAYEITSGREMWAHEYPALFHETLGGDGPRATPTVTADRVFALGASGVLTCVDAATGQRIWSTDILADNEVANLQWGMSGSPLVVNNLVIVNPGSQKGTPASRALAAYDAVTGELRWRGGEAQASYSSPMLATLAGQEQILLFDAAGLAGFNPADGTELWRTPWKTNFDNNAAQPLLLPDDQILISSEAGTALVRVSLVDGQWQVVEIWHNNRLKSSYANPVVRGDHVYGLDQGILACLEWKTGKRLWKQGRYGHGQLLLADDLLVVLTEQGELVLVEAVPDAHHELGRVPGIAGKTWNNPVLVRGRALVRNHLEMACFDLSPSP